MLFNDIVGLRGNCLPITAVVANLADPRDGGRKKGCRPGAPDNTLAGAATSQAVMNSCVSASLAAIREFGM